MRRLLSKVALFRLRIKEPKLPIFRKASQWAKTILLEPDKKAYYQKKAYKLKLPNAYTAAIADYMRSVKVMRVNQYADKMTFSVCKKDFDVTQVEIVLS